MTEVRRVRPLNRAVNGRAPARDRQCEFRIEEMTLHAMPGGNMEWRERRYAKRGLDPERCAHPANIKIVGRCLCAKHAGQVALEILLKERSEDGTPVA